MILMTKPPDLVKAIDAAYRTTIELAQDRRTEFVCGLFHCGECRECKTCDTVRTAEEWEWRYRDWKESLNAKERCSDATDKNQR